MGSTPNMTRPSNHVAPNGTVQVARHYIRDLVYGANDGLITTFAVVAAAAGGALSAKAVLIIGIANLFADGLSMGVGNYLGIRSDESARAAADLPEEESQPARHGAATMAAFVTAGAVPLIPYGLGLSAGWQFGASIAMTFLTLFGVGAARAIVTLDRWWVAGLEMLGLGTAVAMAAYGIGVAVARLV